MIASCHPPRILTSRDGIPVLALAEKVGSLISLMTSFRMAPPCFNFSLKVWRSRLLAIKQEKHILPLTSVQNGC